LHLERLEDRLTPSTTITPEPLGIAGPAGNLVEFRKGPAGFISSPSISLAHGDALFALPVADANVIADATDNGVAVINYLDSGGGNDFASPRDVGIAPLTAVKRTDMASGGTNPNSPNVNSGTFNPNAEDDEVAMQASGVIFIPNAGPWTFVVKSDDGFRLTLGTNNAVVGEFDGGRASSYGNNQGGAIDSVANVSAAGYYPYHLLWIQGLDGAMAQLTAVQGSSPEPTDGSSGSLPAGSQLVGDTANGGLAVFQTFTPAPVAKGTPVTAAEGTVFSGTVATFTDANPGVTAATFSATINYGDGSPTVTVTSTASANGQIVPDLVISGQFDVQGAHTFEEGHFNILVKVTNTTTSLSGSTASFTQANLVTDDQAVLASEGFAAAAHTDAHLRNPWGIAFGPTSPFWVSNNATGTSTLYDGSGNPQALVVTIPVANSGASNGTGSPTSPAPPTGIVFNGSPTDFLVAGAGTAAHFVFATEDGTIAAWNSGTSAVLKVDDADFTNGPVYKGLAIGNNGTGSFLYATNFRTGTIDVFDTNFNKVTLGSGGFGTFTDPTPLPAGFAPFGIQNLGGQLFVTYAMQNASRHDDVKGLGNGFVDVFDLSGNFVKRFASGGTLNSPWGLALAPSTFGAFGGALLVGNFGDGFINAFNASTGAFLGQLADATNVPISIQGLWGLTFGNNGQGGNVGTLYFTAGINDEADGLFGSLTVVQNSTATVPDAALLPGNNASGGVTPFSGVGGTNAAGGATTAMNSFKAAVGGANNGATPSPQTGGFRVITWDGVKLDGTDFGGNSTVIDPGHVVGIPINRFQNVGVQFEQVYAVSGPASGTDPSTFSTVNPSLTNLFPAFSPANTFAMFNENTIDLSFVLASSPTAAPTPAATRGFGAIFRNVELPNSTSIEYFNGDTSLGKFFVPVGGAGQAEFLGELFNSPVVTRVTLTLGTDVLFSFDGTHFTAGSQPNDPVNGHNLVVTDDFVFAEPVASSASQPGVSAVAGTAFNGPVATFSDLDPKGTQTDYTATITWGDGHTSAGTVAPNGSGGFTVSGSNTYATAGSFPISVQVQDLGGSSVALTNTATVQQPFANQLDFGSAPDGTQFPAPNTYPTLLAHNGARHVITGLRLGNTVTPSADGQPNPTAAKADADGVTFLSPLVAGGTAAVRVNVQGAPAGGALLDAWIDFNVNGSWLDAGEQIFASAHVVNGDNVLTFGVPAAAAVGAQTFTFARFRLSTAGGLAPTGQAADGEVEDYRVALMPAPTTVFVNPAFTGTPGTDPDGSGPATAIGFDAFASLQQALNAVNTGGTLMVAAGTYTGGLTLTRSVIVRGAGSGTTIITGQGSGTGLAITAQGAVLSGLMVRNFGVGLTAGAGTVFLSLTDVGLQGNTFGGGVTGVNTVLVAGGAANETFFVRPGLLARQGDNPLGFSRVQFLTVDGGGGSNRLVVFLNDISTPDTVWISGNAVSRDGAAFLLFYRDTGGTFGQGVNFVLSDSSETVIVQGQQAGTPTTIFAQGGDDAFFVAVTAGSAYTNLTLDGGPGNDRLGVFDKTGGAQLQGVATAGGQGRVIVTYPNGSSSEIDYQNLEGLPADLPVTIAS
jgi:uncharacterized protein (TIGR03118 family)